MSEACGAVLRTVEALLGWGLAWAILGSALTIALLMAANAAINLTAGHRRVLTLARRMGKRLNTDETGI